MNVLLSSSLLSMMMGFGGLLGGENHRLKRCERFGHSNEVVLQQLEEEEEGEEEVKEEEQKTRKMMIRRGERERGASGIKWSIRL